MPHGAASCRRARGAISGGLHANGPGRARRLFAQVVQAHVRSDDVVGRYGGEESVLLFPGQSVAGAGETRPKLAAPSDPG